MAELSNSFLLCLSHSHRSPTTPDQIRFGLFPVRSPLLRESLVISFPLGTKMFQFPRFAFYSVEFMRFTHKGFPIRTPPTQSLLTAHRGLSQFSTSFIAIWCQDILHLPFLRWLHLLYLTKLFLCFLRTHIFFSFFHLYRINLRYQRTLWLDNETKKLWDFLFYLSPI